MRESVTGGRCQHRSVEEGIDGAMAKALCPLRVLARVRNPIYAAAPGRVNRVKSERKIDGSGKRRWEMTAAAPLGSGADSARLGSAAAPPPPSQAGTSTGRWVNRENVTLGVAGEPQLHVGKPGNGAGRNPSVGEGRAERGSRAARPRVPGGRKVQPSLQSGKERNGHPNLCPSSNPGAGSAVSTHGRAGSVLGPPPSTTSLRKAKLGPQHPFFQGAGGQ